MASCGAIVKQSLKFRFIQHLPSGCVTRSPVQHGGQVSDKSKLKLPAVTPVPSGSNKPKGPFRRLPNVAPLRATAFQCGLRSANSSR